VTDRMLRSGRERVAERDPLRVTWAVLLFAVAPLAILLVLQADVFGVQYAWDFHAFWHGAREVVHGRSPYRSFGMSPVVGRPWDLYMYPPLLAELIAPLGLLPFTVAAVAFVAASALAVLLALWLLGVRDWRCYGLAFLWFPVLHGLGLGALTPFLLLGVAACWRFRRAALRSVPLAITVVFKLFLWPLLVWEAGRAGIRSGARAVAVGLLLAGASWASIGFAGLGGYPSLLRSAESHWETDGYGLGAVARHAGLSASATGTLLLAGGLVASAVVFLALRRGWVDERGGLALVIGIACAFSPVSWLHYSTLLLVPVALASPRLGPAWFLPLAYWATPFEETHGTPWRVAVGLAVVWGTVALCLSDRGRAGATSASSRADLRVAPSGAHG
jgi:Glycosyltransferase family 87